MSETARDRPSGGEGDSDGDRERKEGAPRPLDSWVPVWREERLGPGWQVLPEPCACVVGGGGMHTDTWAVGRRPWAWLGHQQVPTEHLLFSRRWTDRRPVHAP